MSKLIQAIAAVDSGIRADFSKKLNYTDIKIEWIKDPIDIRAAYRIGVKIESKAFIENDLNSKIDTVAEAVKDVKRAVIEEIFGEFRAPITNIKVALYDRDLTKARNLLAALEDQMFHEGLE